MIAQLHLLVVVVLAARERVEAVEVSRYCKAVVRRTSFAAFVPLFAKDIVEAASFSVSGRRIVIDRLRNVVLHRLVAERALVLQPDVPARLNTIVVGCGNSGNYR